MWSGSWLDPGWHRHEALSFWYKEVHASLTPAGMSEGHLAWPLPQWCRLWELRSVFPWICKEPCGQVLPPTVTRYLLLWKQNGGVEVLQTRKLAHSWSPLASGPFAKSARQGTTRQPSSSCYAPSTVLVSPLYDSDILESNSVQKMNLSLSQKVYKKKESAVEEHLLSELERQQEMPQLGNTHLLFHGKRLWDAYLYFQWSKYFLKSILLVYIPLSQLETVVAKPPASSKGGIRRKKNFF